MNLTRPVFLAIVALFVFVANSIGQTSTEDFNLDSLLIKSVGGPTAKERISQLQTARAVGSVQLGGFNGRFELVVALPDKLFMKLVLGSVELTQAIDGQTAWQRDFNGAVSQVSGFEKKELVSQVYFQTYSYLFPDRVRGGKEYRGLLETDTASYHEVWFYPLGNDTLQYFFDAATGRPAWSATQMDNIEAFTYYSDFRTVEGVESSFRSLTVALTAGLTTSFEVDSLEFDVTVAPGLFTHPESSRKDFVFPDGVDSVVVPFRFERGHIYLPVTINGRLIAWMILDSGASANMYHSPVIDSLDLPVVGTHPAIGISGFVDVDFVVVDSLALGELRLYSQVAGSIDLSGIARVQISGRPFCGILGYDFLARFPVCIKYDREELIVYNPDNFSLPTGGVRLPFRFTLQVPTIEASISGIPGDYLIDLGNALGLILHAGFTSSSSLVDSLKNVEELAGGTVSGIGGKSSGRRAIAHRFQIGRLQYDSLKVLITEPNIGLAGSTALAGNIGSQLLSDYHLLFDYSKQTVVFLKP